MKKIKATKKSSAKTEEVITMTQRVMVLAEEHPFWVVGALAGLLLVLGLVWGGYRYEVAKDQQARAAYAKVMQQWPKHETANSKEWGKIAADLQHYTKQHQGTIPALHAQMNLAQAYFWMHRYADAVRLDRELLKHFSGNSELQPLVRYHLALTYQEMGKSKEAIAQWQLLQNQAMPGLEREANWHLANLYLQQKDYAKAVTYFEKAIQTAGGYPSQMLIQQELAAAKVKSKPAVIPKASTPKEESKG